MCNVDKTTSIKFYHLGSKQMAIFALGTQYLKLGHQVIHPWKTEAGVIAAGGDALTSQLP
jgi:hypothetical protein